MKHLIALTIFFLVSTSSAGSYWEIEIPVVENAINIKTKKTDNLYTSIKSYDVVIDDPDVLYDFYNRFFIERNWKNPMSQFKSRPGFGSKKWNAFNARFDEDDKPVVHYGSAWINNNPPATGNVSVKLNNYKNGKFHASVEVALAPKIDISPLFRIQEIVSENPKNLFILYKAIGGNPFEIDELNIIPKEKYKNEQVVSQYFEAISQIAQQYKTYGNKYGN